MLSGPKRLSLLCFAGLAACSGSHGGADAGPPAPDSGVDAGCTLTGLPCDPYVPCCQSNASCDPVSNVCVADAGCTVDGDACDPTVPCCDANAVCNPSLGQCTPDAGNSSGGTSGGGPPNDGAQWQPEAIAASVKSLLAVSVPSSSIQLAVGNGPGGGQLIVNSVDGGWSLVPGAPHAAALWGVAGDSAGDVFAVGVSDAGTGLLLVGTLNGGLTARSLNTFSALQAVVALGHGEALAAGLPATEVLHLWPDGGLTYEQLPAFLGLSSVNRLAHVDGGCVYGLALPSDADLGPYVIERDGGTWTALPQVLPATSTNATISDLTVGPEGDVLVVGSDGNGHGLAFAWADAGFQIESLDGGLDAGAVYLGMRFLSVPLPTGTPALTAVCEPQPGRVYLAAEASLQASVLALDAGEWWSEGVPGSAQTINAMAGDSAGDVFAVGAWAAPTSGFALQRVP